MSLNSFAQDSLKLYWKCNITDGTHDISSNGNNGHVTGLPILIYNDCDSSNSAYKMSGSTITSDSNVSIDFSSGLAISMWLILPYHTQTKLFDYGIFHIYYDGLNIIFTDNADTLYSFNPIGGAGANNWLNYTVTINTTTNKINSYIQPYSGGGTNDSTNYTVGSLSIDTDIVVGNSIDSTFSIYNIAVFNKTLNATDISHFISCPTTEIKDIAQTKISIYPNPTNDIVTINSPVIIEKVEITNMLGQSVLHEKSAKTIDLSGLKKGMYILKVNDTFVSELIKN